VSSLLADGRARLLSDSTRNLRRWFRGFVRASHTRQMFPLGLKRVLKKLSLRQTAPQWLKPRSNQAVMYELKLVPFKAKTFQQLIKPPMRVVDLRKV